MIKPAEFREWSLINRIVHLLVLKTGSSGTFLVQNIKPGMTYIHYHPQNLRPKGRPLIKHAEKPKNTYLIYPVVWLAHFLVVDV